MRRDQLEHAIRAARQHRSDRWRTWRTLPIPHYQDWDQRTVAVSNEATRGNTGYCLEAHDLAAGKLVAGREKDRIFVATLLMEKLVDSETLLKRVAALPIEAERRASIARWIRVTVEDIA